MSRWAQASVADELLQDQRRGDGAAMGAADVFHVGDTALDQLFIFLHQRQLPEFFTGFLAAPQQTIRQRLVVAEDAANLRAESGHAGAGQAWRD